MVGNTSRAAGGQRRPCGVVFVGVGWVPLALLSGCVFDWLASDWGYTPLGSRVCGGVVASRECSLTWGIRATRGHRVTASPCDMAPLVALASALSRILLFGTERETSVIIRCV